MNRLQARSGALAAGALAALVGGMVLLGWALDITALKSVLPGWVSMKPNTAVAFVLTGIALLASALSLRMSKAVDAPGGSRQATWLTRLALFCALFAGLVGLLSLAEYAFGWNLGFDQWLFPEPPGAVGTSHPGRMAPDTALCFLLFATGWAFAYRPRLAHWTWIAALLCGAAITTVALIEILSYFTPTLRTHGWGGLTMMALPTATLFGVLGVVLIRLLVLAKYPGHGPSDQAIERADTAWLKFVLVFVTLTIGILASGTFLYRNFERKFHIEAGQQLAAIAELKVSELTQYRKERIGDAGILFKNPAFAALVRRVLTKPGDLAARQQLQSWLDQFQLHDDYDVIRLLDMQGLSRLSSPREIPAASAVTMKGAAEACRLGQLVFQDFYVSEADHKIHLAILVPILDDAHGNRPLGAIVLRIDPSNYLYPFIQHWPMPSTSGETLLVRREDNEAVVLNELRFQTNSALTMRRSLSIPNMPLVMAARGQEGIVEGLDYRGEPVLAALQAVPNSPWFLVARRDLKEVYAPLRTQLWQAIALVCVLVFGTGAGVGLMWRQQRVRFYRKQADSAEALRENELKYRALFETAEGAILLFADGRWVDCNEGALKVFGCTREQIIGAHPSRFSPPLQPDGRSSEEEASKKFAQAFAAGPQVFEWEHCRLDGTPFAAEVSLNRLELKGQPHVQAIVRDVTERKQSEAALQVEKQNLDALFESSPVALLVLDDTTAIVKVNRAALTLTGGSESEFLNHRPGNALRCEHSATDPRGCGYGEGCPLCPARHALEALIASGDSMHGAELTLQLLRNGAPERVHLRLGGEPVMYNGARHLMVAMDDITQQKQAEAENIALNSTLEQRVRERTGELEAAITELEAFSYSVSHDLRAPLRHMAGFVELLDRRDTSGLDEKSRHYLTVISEAAKKMGHLIDDLLSFSRMGRGEMMKASVDLKTLTQEVIAELAKETRPSRPIEWHLGDLPTVNGDRAMLRLVLVNLISNAIKYSSHSDATRIEVGALAPDGQDHILYVRDNGAGFDMQYVDKLYGLFQRLHSNAEYDGTGVGLANVRRIITRHGGRTWAEGALNQGAIFYFTLPLQRGL